MVFPQALGKIGPKPAFSLKSKVAVPELKFWNSFYIVAKRLKNVCFAAAF
jgi:hypothetical protein